MNLGAKESFGRYIALESPLHGLDPFIKILMFAAVIVSVLLAVAWHHLACLAAYVVILCLLSRVRIAFYLDSLKYFSWMFALSFAINVIFPRAGGTPRLRGRHELGGLRHRPGPDLEPRDPPRLHLCGRREPRPVAHADPHHGPHGGKRERPHHAGPHGPGLLHEVGGMETGTLKGGSNDPPFSLRTP